MRNLCKQMVKLFVVMFLIICAVLIFSAEKPRVSAAATKVNDDGAGITYSGNWTDSNSSSGYYNNDCHFSIANGAYAQFTFTGTVIRWIGAKNNDHGNARVYIDGNLDATIDTYDPAWLKQLVLYEKTGLANGSHTIKVEVTNTKNSGSSNYYQDIDAFEYDDAGPTPTPTPAPTPVLTTVNDDGSGIVYTGSWPENNNQSGYYNNDCHYSLANGAYAQFTFTGTTIRWIGAKNNDHGNAKVYIDGTLNATIDTYDPAWLKQLVLFEKTGLASGSHTIKVEVTNIKNGSSSDYYQDIDAFEYGNGGATPTPGATIRYEAENGTIGGGAQVVNDANASNGQKVGWLDNTGAYVQINNINKSSAGSYYVTIRYAVGYSDTTYKSLYVNGVDVARLSFAPTGSWSAYADKVIPVSLNAGNNTIKIQKDSDDSAGTDIDYLDVPGYTGPPPTPTPLPPKMIGNTLLPGQVPYLNPKRWRQTLFSIGTGVVMGIGDSYGGWTMLFGPGYAGGNTISSEVIKLVIDGVEQQVTTDIKRASKTGVFYGAASYGDLSVYLIDNARWGDPWVSRLIMIDNKSASTSHNVNVRAYVTGMVALLQDSNGVNRGYKNGSARITFNESTTTAFNNGSACVIDTGVKSIAPGASFNTALINYVSDGSKTDSQIVSEIRGMNITGNAEQSITSWQNWFDNVPANYKLDRITDQRARDMMEGGLVTIKNNQSSDGGFMATPTMYQQGYIRDSAYGLRALYETGHFDELKKWVQWVDYKFNYTGHIPDLWYLSPTLGNTGYFDMGNSDFEQTSLYVLTARNYYNATADPQTLLNANNSIKYCIDVQLNYADSHGYKVLFSGDETEICGAVDVSGSGISHIGSNEYSFPSAGSLAAALNFYISYLTLKGDNPSSYYNPKSGTTINLNTELSNLKNSMDNTFWRTDVPECPNGFHDAFVKFDGTKPLKRIVNFTLQPVYYGTPYNYADRRGKDVAAIKQYFNSSTGFLQLVPGADTGFDGHDLGYLLWDLVEVGDSGKTDVYNALVNGSTASWMGYWNEAFTSGGLPQTAYNPSGENGLRTMETGVNISAIAKYWGLGF